MEDLVGLIAALVKAWKKGAKGSASPAVVSTTPRVRTVAPPAQATRSGPPSAPVNSSGPTLQAVGAVARVPEAGLVRALFATPQSLVAAFIVAEVLAKPVALREP